jgi:hypothetical protein
VCTWNRYWSNIEVSPIHSDITSDGAECGRSFQKTFFFYINTFQLLL